MTKSFGEGHFLASATGPPKWGALKTQVVGDDL